jgi:hypothetical protein
MAALNPAAQPARIAIDGGIDTRKSETLGFYGQFASVSVGIGG